MLRVAYRPSQTPLSIFKNGGRGRFHTIATAIWGSPGNPNTVDPYGLRFQNCGIILAPQHINGTWNTNNGLSLRPSSTLYSCMGNPFAQRTQGWRSHRFVFISPTITSIGDRVRVNIDKPKSLFTGYTSASPECSLLVLPSATPFTTQSETPQRRSFYKVSRLSRMQTYS